MCCKHVWLFPVLMFTVIQLTFVITYIIAVSNKHVVPIFPYLSDSGAIPPESCIFSQMLNIGALFGIVTAYLRHRQIVEYYKCVKKTKVCLLKTSLVFMWIGIISCFGISVVGNFQETSIKTVHYIGALLAFGPGLLYGYGQTVLTYLIGKVFVGIWMAHFRLIVCIAGTVLLSCVLSTGFASDSNDLLPTINASLGLDNTTYSIDRVQHVADKDFHWYLISTIGEWGFAICCILFFVTFAAEFRKSTLLAPRMVLDSELCNLPNEKDGDLSGKSATNRVETRDLNGATAELGLKLPTGDAESGNKLIEERTLSHNPSIV